MDMALTLSARYRDADGVHSRGLLRRWQRLAALSTSLNMRVGGWKATRVALPFP